MLACAGSLAGQQRGERGLRSDQPATLSTIAWLTSCGSPSLSAASAQSPP
jgi:hypothetical protein